MKAVIEIDLNSPQAKQLLNYIETLPFAKVRTDSAWEDAIASGAVSLSEFDNKFKEEIRKAYEA